VQDCFLKSQTPGKISMVLLHAAKSGLTFDPFFAVLKIRLNSCFNILKLSHCGRGITGKVLHVCESSGFPGLTKDGSRASLQNNFF